MYSTARDSSAESHTAPIFFLLTGMSFFATGSAWVLTNDYILRFSFQAEPRFEDGRDLKRPTGPAYNGYRALSKLFEDRLFAWFLRFITLYWFVRRPTSLGVWRTSEIKLESFNALLLIPASRDI